MLCLPGFSPQYPYLAAQPKVRQARAAGGFSPEQSVLCTSRREEVSQVYDTPLLDLVFKAATVHRMYNDPQMVSPSYLPLSRGY